MTDPSTTPRFATPVSSARAFGLKLRLATAACSFVAASAAIAQCSDGWIPGIGNPGAQDRVYAVQPLPDGDFIVTGRFAYAGRPGTGTAGVARGRFLSNGTVAWSSIGGGVQNAGESVGRIHLLEGGDFLFFSNATMSDGTRIAGLGRWNQSTQRWTSDGMAIRGRETVFLSTMFPLPDGDLLIGGRFSRLGGGPNNPEVFSNGIVRYNPAANRWTPVSIGTDGIIGPMLMLPDGDVLIGGLFATAGNQPWANLVRYNPDTDTWSPVYGGTDGSVGSLTALPDGDILVTGNFTRAGGIAADRMARYNPITHEWTDMRLRSDWPAALMAELEDGTLMFGGAFNVIGGVPASRIARYDPWNDRWIVDGGVNADLTSTVRSITLHPNGDLIVGGSFDVAGGYPAHNIARYRPTLIPPVVLLQPQPQATCSGGTARFSVLLGWEKDFTYEWSKDGIAIDATLNPTAATSTLVLEDVGSDDLGDYRCVIAHACASTTSEPASLSICPADFACDSFLDLFDYLEFVSLFELSSPHADFNADGFVDFFDYDAFVAAFEAGC